MSSTFWGSRYQRANRLIAAADDIPEKFTRYVIEAQGAYARLQLDLQHLAHFEAAMQKGWRAYWSFFEKVAL